MSLNTFAFSAATLQLLDHVRLMDLFPRAAEIEASWADYGRTRREVNWQAVNSSASKELDATDKQELPLLWQRWNPMTQKYEAASPALPPKHLYVLSLYPVYRYLQHELRRLGVTDDAFVASVLQGVAMTVLHLNCEWATTPPLDDLYSRVSEGTGLAMGAAATLCREVDTQVGSIIFHHLPDLGRQDLLKLVSYEFIHNHDLRLTLQYLIPLLPAPIRDTGAGLSGSV